MYCEFEKVVRQESSVTSIFINILGYLFLSCSIDKTMKYDIICEYEPFILLRLKELRKILPLFYLFFAIKLYTLSRASN